VQNLLDKRIKQKLLEQQSSQQLSLKGSGNFAY
jgi:hypothetical protein